MCLSFLGRQLLEAPWILGGIHTYVSFVAASNEQNLATMMERDSRGGAWFCPEFTTHVNCDIIYVCCLLPLSFGVSFFYAATDNVWTETSPSEFES